MQHKKENSVETHEQRGLKQSTHTDEQEKRFEDYTLKQLMEMKEEMEEIYGHGVLKKHVVLDIVRMLVLNTEQS